MFLFFGYWSYNQSLIIYFSISIVSIIGLLIYGKTFFNKMLFAFAEKNELYYFKTIIIKYMI